MSNIEHVRSTAARAAHGATAAVAGRSASLPQAGAAPGAGFADLLGLMGLANEGAELVPGLAGDAPSDSASDSASDPVGVGVGTSLAQGTVGGWPLGSEGLAPAGAPPEVAAPDAGVQAGAVPPQWMMQMAVLRGTPPAVSAGAPAASAASAAGGVGAVSGPGVGVGVASAAPGLSAAAQEAGAALAGRLGQDSALSADQRQASGLESPDAAVSATALPPGLAFKSSDPSAATPGQALGTVAEAPGGARVLAQALRRQAMVDTGPGAAVPPGREPGAGKADTAAERRSAAADSVGLALGRMDEELARREAAASLEPVRATASERKDEAGERAGGVHGARVEGLDTSGGVTATVAGADPASGAGGGGTGARNPEDVVAEQVTYWMHQKKLGAELTVDGGAGTPVEVSIAMNGNEAQIAFRSDQAGTRDMLTNALPELRQLLQGEGLVLAGVTVGQSQGRPSGDAPADGTASARQGGGVRRAGKLVEDDMAVQTVTRRVTSQRVLDLFV